jgi:hypothetical protein
VPHMRIGGRLDPSFCGSTPTHAVSKKPAPDIPDSSLGPTVMKAARPSKLAPKIADTGLDREYVKLAYIMRQVV